VVKLVLEQVLMSGLRCAWINNVTLALGSSPFSFCFETLIVVEHEKVYVSETL
jgi:hypothetical protein